ncbi:hypothetical protein CEXT_742101 [Caerostris extrusa]|uniref:Uncharacterized protein n=1 Tax=Caerostris extrusa TaxID=172846 RepID=A0AAV4SHN4_CAEEX|nr:hypothetical protein CEXT_742101 [Caerostris extrusa]
MKEKQFFVGRRIDRRSFEMCHRTMPKKRSCRRNEEGDILCGPITFSSAIYARLECPLHCSLVKRREKSTICDLRRLFENTDSKGNNKGVGVTIREKNLTPFDERETILRRKKNRQEEFPKCVTKQCPRKDPGQERKRVTFSLGQSLSLRPVTLGWNAHCIAHKSKGWGKKDHLRFSTSV